MFKYSHRIRCSPEAERSYICNVAWRGKKTKSSGKLTSSRIQNACANIKHNAGYYGLAPGLVDPRDWKKQVVVASLKRFGALTLTFL